MSDDLKRAGLGLIAGVLGANTLVQLVILVFVAGVSVAVLDTLFPLIVVFVSVLVAEALIKAFPDTFNKVKGGQLQLMAVAIGLLGAFFSIFGGITDVIFENTHLESQSVLGVSPQVNININPIVTIGASVVLLFAFLALRGGTPVSVEKKSSNVPLIGFFVLLVVGAFIFLNVAPRDTVCPDGGFTCTDPVDAYTVIFPAGAVSNCASFGVLCDGEGIEIKPEGLMPEAEAQEVSAQGTSRIMVSRSLVCGVFEKSDDFDLGQLGTLTGRTKFFPEWKIKNVPENTCTWVIGANGVLGEEHTLTGTLELK